MTRRLPTTLAVLGLMALGKPGLQAQQTTIGLRGGISVASASLDADATLQKENRTGFAGGVFLDYASSGLFGFQVGAQYTQKGVDLDVGAVANDFDLAYLEIPAVLKLGLPLGIIRPSVFGGAALSFKTSCDSGGTDCGDGIKGTDFTGVAGADLAVYLGGISFWADARYHFGLQDITDTDAVVGELKNRNWTLQVGLGF